MDRNKDPIYTGHVSLEDHLLLEEIGNLKNSFLNRNRSGKQRLDTGCRHYGDDHEAGLARFQAHVDRLKAAGYITQVRQYGRAGFLYLKNDPVPEDVQALFAEHGWREPLMFDVRDWRLKGIWRLNYDWGRTFYWRTVLEQLAYPRPENRGWSMKEKERVL